MPPYTPVVSKSQSRALFAKAGRGELSMAEAKGKTKAAHFSRLPERKGERADSPRHERSEPTKERKAEGDTKTAALQGLKRALKHGR